MGQKRTCGRTGWLLDRGEAFADFAIYKESAGQPGAIFSAAYRNESAFRQEVSLALLMVPAALWLGTSWAERSLLIAAVLLVLIVELLNSGIEAVVDRVSFELHDLSKRAKDYGSAAVALSLLLCTGIWAAALWARLAP